jgi:hypothetical protein
MQRFFRLRVYSPFFNAISSLKSPQAKKLFLIKIISWFVQKINFQGIKLSLLHEAFEYSYHLKFKYHASVLRKCYVQFVNLLACIFLFARL